MLLLTRIAGVLQITNAIVRSAWPERFFVIDTDGDIAYIAHPHDEWGFDRQRVRLLLTCRLSASGVALTQTRRSKSTHDALSGLWR